MSMLEKMTMLALGICGVSSIIGCNDHGAPTENDDTTGEVGIALQIPPGLSSPGPAPSTRPPRRC